VTDAGRRCQRFFITGQVQGVWFRASTAREATRLGLVGWAQNLADGRVEVLAAGAIDAIDELARWLQVGPPAATVHRVESAPADLAECAGLCDFRTG
jgi:acylphosphatase